MEIGGSERLVHNIALNIDRKLFNPSIAWFYGNSILDEFSALGIPLYHIPKLKRIDLFTMRKIANIIKKNNIHIVNAHHFMSMVYAFYGCKIINNIKLIYTEHSKVGFEKISWKWRLIGSYLLNRCDFTVGVNEVIVNFLKNKFKLPLSKGLIIKNGVDLHQFSAQNGKMKKKIELGIDNNCRVIGIVANLRKVKNHIFLIKAFDAVLKEVKNVKLLLIGQGFDNDSNNSETLIRNFINKKGLDNKVILLGFRSDIPEVLNIMDIFCLTSLKEGLPISIIEAMGAGLPLVGTDVEGIRDVIVPNRNGFLVQLGDIKGLKNVLVNLLQNEDLRKKMGQESLSMAKQRYSLDQCINQYQNLFISIMNK